MFVVMSGASVTSYNKNRQITNAVLGFGIAAASTAGTFLYLTLCYEAIKEVGSYHAQWGSGAYFTISGASVMWLAAVLQVFAACVGGPAQKLVPLPVEELVSPAQIPKHEVHYA
jgi:hypothetical protein